VMSTAAREDPKAKAEAEAEAEAEADDHNEYAEYAARLKDQGNEAFKAGDIALSITFYTQAIDMDPDNHVYYSNRSAGECGVRCE
jgi:tetratricopeptide (TPR) repeat protein